MTEYKNNKTSNIYFLNLLKLFFKNYIHIINYDNITEKQYQSLNATECTTFFVTPSLANRNTLDVLPIREHASRAWQIWASCDKSPRMTSCGKYGPRIIVPVKNMMC